MPILPPREIQVMWSQNHDIEVLHCNAVKVGSTGTRDNTMPAIVLDTTGTIVPAFRPNENQKGIGMRQDTNNARSTARQRERVLFLFCLFFLGISRFSLPPHHGCRRVYAVPAVFSTSKA